MPGLQGLIDAGWVVCATDYQGMGTPGRHQYLVNRTNARDAVNIAHAARQLDVGTGLTLGSMGWSQGGGAAAAVAELDADDFGDLRLVGTVAMSPTVPAIALRSPSGPAAPLVDASIAPSAHVVMMLCGIQAANPSTLNLSDVFTPVGVEIIEAAWNTQPVHHLNDTLARAFRLQGPVLAPRPANFGAWETAIHAGSAASREPVAPVLVCIDSFDGGTVQPVAWQSAYATAVKALGGTIDVRYYLTTTISHCRPRASPTPRPGWSHCSKCRESLVHRHHRASGSPPTRTECGGYALTANGFRAYHPQSTNRFTRFAALAITANRTAPRRSNSRSDPARP